MGVHTLDAKIKGSPILTPKNRGNSRECNFVKNDRKKKFKKSIFVRGTPRDSLTINEWVFNVFIEMNKIVVYGTFDNCQTRTTRYYFSRLVALMFNLWTV